MNKILQNQTLPTALCPKSDRLQKKVLQQNFVCQKKPTKRELD